MPNFIDLNREELARRAAIVREVTARTDCGALTRPARAEDKRTILARRNGLGPFAETDTPRPTDLPGRAASTNKP